MDAAAGRREASPDRTSDGKESPSAPSEYLAEFLSAIMRRQYAEAVKYCRLILQYEPHNATARGFYPLLHQKLRDQRRAAGLGGGSGGGRHVSSGSEAGLSSPEEEEGSSSLDLDSEGSGSVCGSGSASGDRTDSASCSWLSAAAARWEGERSDADDNGNLPPLAPPTYCDGDLENDNAPAPAPAPAGCGSCSDSGDSHAPANSGARARAGSAASLQWLRAQFACYQVK